jgi:hypothetical protein
LFDPGMQIIYLDVEDDIVSISDRLDWVESSPVVLVVPEGADLLLEPLDLVRLRRFADRQRLELGLVTADGRIAAPSKGVGIPVFRTIEQAESSRRGWWRGRRRRERVGEPTRLDPADRVEIQRRLAPQLSWQQWLWRYVSILVFFLTLATLFVGVAYAVPQAVITLRPERQRVEISRQIVADPQLAAISFSGASAPGRQLATTVEWRAEVETTGTVEVADAPARGKVIFVNLIAQPVTVPAGTRVSASAGQTVVFQTLAPVEVAGVSGATAEADVVAIVPGPTGNVAVNQINRVEGSLGLQLEVRNLESFSGGGSRQARAVTVADQERLRAQTLQQLQALALAEMSARLTESEFLARDSVRVVRLVHETYSHFVGEQTERLTLEIRAELQATAVDETQATGLIYEQLVTAVPPGFELLPDSLDFWAGQVTDVDAQGRVSFEMFGAAEAARQLDLERILAAVAGQEIDLAMAYLYEQLPLRDYPTVTVWPNWFGRLPYLPARIQTVQR